ncbi:MAG: type III pantothenate kinase [bacterium]|nr:type III pantothenate kinase [bacterium]
MNDNYYLAFDIGNTQTSVGIFKGMKLLKSWRFDTVKGRKTNEYISLIDGFIKQINVSSKKIKAFIISNVVPETGKEVRKFSQKYLNIIPIEAGNKINLDIKIVIDNPEELGADRIANAVGGFKEYKGPVIIVDYGTATTYDCVSEKGEYLGGIILPGIKISAEVLYLKTAKLPKVEIIKPLNIIGKNTVDGINSGLYYGTIFQTEGIIRALKKELKFKENSKVIATGGLSGFLSKDVKSIDIVDPFLTLKGLRLILEKNIDK